MPDLPTRLVRKWCLRGQMDGAIMACQCDRIAAAILEALEEAEKAIQAIVSEWEDAYPEDVFKPVEAEEVGVSRDRIAAHQGRHMARELKKQIAAALAALRKTP